MNDTKFSERGEHRKELDILYYLPRSEGAAEHVTVGVIRDKTRLVSRSMGAYMLLHFLVQASSIKYLSVASVSRLLFMSSRHSDNQKGRNPLRTASKSTLQPDMGPPNKKQKLKPLTAVSNILRMCTRADRDIV